MQTFLVPKHQHGLRSFALFMRAHTCVIEAQCILAPFFAFLRKTTTNNRSFMKAVNIRKSIIFSLCIPKRRPFELSFSLVSILS